MQGQPGETEINQTAVNDVVQLKKNSDIASEVTTCHVPVNPVERAEQKPGSEIEAQPQQPEASTGGCLQSVGPQINCFNNSRGK